MRKALLVVSAIGVLTLGIAGMSSASETQWTANFYAASDFNTAGPVDSGSYAMAGTKTTGAQDGPEQYDNYPLAPGVTGGIAAWYRTNWTSLDPTNTSNLWSRDFRAALKSGEVKTWEDLVVYATPGYTAPTIKLYVESSAKSVMPNSIGGHPVVYKLVMTYHPDSYTGQTEWILPSVPTAGGMLATIALPSAGAVTSNPFAATQVAGYRFNFVTPEPGSLLVLASGLTGLLGLARRRSA